jgi:hypothetical protein
MKGQCLCVSIESVILETPEEEAKHEQTLRKWSEKVNEES